MLNLDFILTPLIYTISIFLGIFVLGRLIDIVSKFIIKIIANVFGVKFALIFANYITFIGTIHHELAHAIVAFLTGAKLTEVHLFKPTNGSLGQVRYIARGNMFVQGIQNTMSAIAPVFLGICTEIILSRILMNYCTNLVSYVVLLYIIISILLHMNMSQADVKVALKGVPACFIITFILLIILL